MLPNLLPDPALPHAMVRGRHGCLVYNRHDTVVGRSVEAYGEYFESEVDVFRRCLRPGMHVADVGANIGTHALAMARLVGPSGWVHAFEPQRVVHQLLCANMAVNAILNADCERLAVGAGPGRIAVEELDFTTANNFGGLALGHSAAGRSVAVVALDDYLDGRPLHFLKADVQGMEEQVLRGARRTIAAHRPPLYLEADQPEATPALVRLLVELGYHAYWHLPRFYRPDNFAANSDNVHGLGWVDRGGSHLECIGIAVNLFCVPAGTTVEGLLPYAHDHPLDRAANRFHGAMPRAAG